MSRYFLQTNIRFSFVLFVFSTDSFATMDMEMGVKIQFINVSFKISGDLIQSIGVLISSVIIKIWPEYKKADPACTVLFSIIVFFTTVTVLRDSVLILLESKPSSKDYDAIYSDLKSLAHVVKIHDLHIWSLTTDQQILSVHLAVDTDKDKEAILQNALQMLRTRHGINK